ncbi:hypothetical protein VNI00_005852 [Paramarasmius palmivorus]|uniref:CST complex subunit STN1 n=1 Tax=Paramarasmius palmivorus TaxID=297713 RepID=A0AAW0DD12_9AGAR
MSLTSIIEHTTSTSGSVFLTPRKRRKPSPEPPSEPVPTSADIFNWVLKPEATATCFIRDVLNLRQNAGEDFYWLKRVPCRNVKLVGLIVGVQILEKRIIYTVDDGTAVIDCQHRCANTPPSPTKPSQSKSKTKTDLQAKNQHLANGLAPLPKPLARIGDHVHVSGKVVQHFESRQIIATTIEKSSSSNDQPLHWKEVLELHNTYYSSSEPFIIPTPILIPPEPNQLVTQVNSSPVASATASPAKSVASSHQSPRKLRHPSKLRSRDLTGITFRIYVKHFMDNYHTMLTNPDTTDAEDSNSDSDCFATPTKPSRRPRLDDQTPRRRSAYDATNTPRPSRSGILDVDVSGTSGRGSDSTPQLRGFTLSFLRRVPELHDMARRVVKAETKRRARDAKKKTTVKGGSANTNTSRSIPSTSASASTSMPGSEVSTAARMKRLWRSTIVHLAKEGSIVLWEGPVYPLPTDDDSIFGGPWKSASQSLSRTANTTAISVFSTASERSSNDDDDEEVVLSDPEANEESYVSLSPQFFAIEVEKVIKSLAAGSKSTGKGPTKQRILAYFRRDDRWQQIGEWQVQEALNVLRNEGRAWDDRHGVWDLIL